MKTILQSIRLMSAPVAALALFALCGAPTHAQSLTDSLASSPAPMRSAAAAPHHARHHKRASDTAAQAPAVPATVVHRRAHSNPSLEASAAAVTTPESSAHARKLKAADAQKASVKAPVNTMGLTIQQSPPRASSNIIPAAAPVPHHRIKVPAAMVSLDDMTRDGSIAKQDSSLGDTGAMNIGGAILRAVLALAFVLALVVSIVYALRKKGYGVAAPGGGYSSIPTSAVGGTPIRGSVRGAGNWKLAKESASFVAPAAARLNTMDDLEVLSHQLLPGATSSLYKVRVGDRVLLLGCSPEGALSTLTEWDVETKPETDESFETLLNEMEADTGEYPFARSSGLNGTAERISQTVKRLSSIGGAGKPLRTL